MITREQALQWAKEAGLWNDWYAEMWKKENAPRMEAFAALVEQHVRAEPGEAQPVADFVTINGVRTIQTRIPLHMVDDGPLYTIPPSTRELVEALRELVARCDGEEGVRADGSNIQTMHANALLAKYGERT